MKTLKEWNKVGGSFTDYCKPGDRIDSDLFYYFIGVVPPVDMSSRGFLMGECAAHNEDGKGVYDCFSERPYRYCGQMTIERFHSKEALCQVD
ncbi:MAG TPA: hypothetical protein EYP35_02530 [Desulfobacterales bacterium]|nr:hypothetical protein [Desulfobacterales bacterium]